MQSGNQNSDDPYVLSRNLAATARLNLQHYIWKEEFGYLVHPDIPIEKEDIYIADVGTGTGIWLLDLAQKLPTSARLQGLDISLDQTPPGGWLPPNVSFHNFNIFEKIPEGLVEKFDVVHVRHLVLVVKNNEPLPVLQQLLKLLKPGGYLQWGEVNLLSRKTVKSNPANSSDKLKQLQDEVQELMHAPFSSWPVNLGDAYKAQGMINISTKSTWTREPYLSFAQANNLLIQEELTNHVPADKKEHFRSLYAEAVAESRQGVAWNIERLITVGQKIRPGTPSGS